MAAAKSGLRSVHVIVDPLTNSIVAFALDVHGITTVGYGATCDEACADVIEKHNAKVEAGFRGPMP